MKSGLQATNSYFFAPFQSGSLDQITDYMESPLNKTTQNSLLKTCLRFTDLIMTFFPLTCLDSVGWRPLPVGSNSEVQAGSCLWPGGVSVGEADGQPTVLQTRVGIQPQAGWCTVSKIYFFGLFFKAYLRCYWNQLITVTYIKIIKMFHMHV